MPDSALGKSVPASMRKVPHEAFQDLLVYQEDTAPAQNALAYADALATAVDGNVSALMLGFMAAYPASIYMEATPDIWLAAQRKADEEALLLEARIKERLKPLRSAPELRRANVMGGEAGQILAQHARYADATILGLNGGGPTDLQRQLFEGALFYSGRPVIVTPEAFRRSGLPKKIMIAWRPGREATRALHDALPLLKLADDIRLVVVDESASMVQEPQPGVDIARHLARHDVALDVKHVPGSGGTTAALLLDEARYFGADLIVMGGYGHSRLREWILGGVTRDVLQATTIPVLMSQ
jgi:nucleotide-binding universal stress UspA family protein